MQAFKLCYLRDNLGLQSSGPLNGRLDKRATEVCVIKRFDREILSVLMTYRRNRGRGFVSSNDFEKNAEMGFVSANNLQKMRGEGD